MLRLALAVLLGATLLAACGNAAPPLTAGESNALVSPQPVAADDSSARSQSTRPLRIAENTFPPALDGDLGFASYSLMAYGIAEALMKVTPEMRIEPWLAKTLEQVDARTWRVTLRANLTFWDGSPVDAAAVQASLERSMQQQPGATSPLLPGGTTFRATDRTLDIMTPEPMALMPSHLASFYLTIKKAAADGTLLYTGPYQPSNFVEKTGVTLTAYDGYWGGRARTRTIDVRYIPDVNTRMLALQSGEVDIAHALLPSQIAQLKAGHFQVLSFASARQNDIILNVTRPPLDDVAVRRAIALGIDREVLVAGVLQGVGTAAYGFAPKDIHLTGVIDTQRFDPDAAEQRLDSAGWALGTDGVRVKGNQKLAFTLGFYQSRPELEGLATMIQAQLEDLGFEITLEQYPDINTTVAENAFDATMYSYSVAPYGDLNRALASLYLPSGTNRDRYLNAQLNDQFVQYSRSASVEDREQRLREMQRIIGEDVPIVYVVNPHQIVALSPSVQGYTPHPLENYKLDIRLWLQE